MNVVIKEFPMIGRKKFYEDSLVIVKTNTKLKTLAYVNIYLLEISLLTLNTTINLCL